ncbi:MAG: nuclear transport factor 2 family protein [Hyphomonas sp.]
MSDTFSLEKSAIADLIARYTINGDRGRVASLAKCFAPNGMLEFPGTTATGPQDIIASLTTGPRNPSLTLVRHHLTSSLIEIENSTHASGRTYFQVFSNIGPDHAGVYVDKFINVEAQWFFAHRQVRIDWQSADSLFRKFDTRH